jgi:hypothetical protein
MRRPAHFPVKSQETVIFAARARLTGELPDVGTDGVLHRNLIRDNGAATPDAGLPSRRRHCRITPMFGPRLPRTLDCQEHWIAKNTGLPRTLAKDTGQEYGQRE